MVVHELSSPKDHRQDRLAGAQVYFTPNGPAARSEMERVWNELSGGESEALVLHVQGRQLELPQYWNGVARATFYDLCGRALGPADYLKLADTVRVLMIEDIPTLGRSNFNEAKRFVTLVDALYEAKVRLIVSAADKPEMLYVEGAGSFEFDRTASRLREMQAVGWGVDDAAG
jgi:cell division protein ZapE